MFRNYPKSATFLFVVVSVLAWSAIVSTAAATESRPNILLIVADDMGYTDWGGFGGEIRTPNLDALAKRGQRLSQFYTAPTCSPTRSMLLTGVDHHLAGLGTMKEIIQSNQQGKPGYEGHLNRRAAILPELLQHSGYRTLMAGKWHLGLDSAQDPSQFGFDESFVLLQGAASHFGDELPYAPAYMPIYRHNGKRVHVPDQFYSSDFYAGRLSEWIADTPAKQPVFAYLAFTAPHDPLHVPEDWLEHYRGQYDVGYDEIRHRRIARLVELGLLDDANKAAPLAPHVPHWHQLTPDQQAQSARSMEIYAAMVENLDANVGKVIDTLKSEDRYDNTLIVFISDNGANGIILQQNPLETPNWVALNSDNRLENLGRKGSRPSTGPGWALAGTAPFALHKLFISEGGVRSPLIVAGPGIAARPQPVKAIATVRDLTPTFLQLAGITAPTVRQGKPLLPIEGRSLVPLLTGQAEQVHPPGTEFGFELFGMRALRKGDWKISNINQPFGTSTWQLFNLADDPGETRNLAQANPDELQQLIAAWDRYGERTGVVLPEKPFFGKGSK